MSRSSRRSVGRTLRSPFSQREMLGALMSPPLAVLDLLDGQAVLGAQAAQLVAQPAAAHGGAGTDRHHDSIW